jgi:cobalt-zinc-cadmium resistance protein CzcA
MSLGAVDVGLLIHGAILIVESVVRRLDQRQHELGRISTAGQRMKMVLAASPRIATPMFFGFSIIAVGGRSPTSSSI